MTPLCHSDEAWIRHEQNITADKSITSWSRTTVWINLRSLAFTSRLSYDFQRPSLSTIATGAKLDVLVLPNAKFVCLRWNSELVRIFHVRGTPTHTHFIWNSRKALSFAHYGTQIKFWILFIPRLFDLRVKFIICNLEFLFFCFWNSNLKLVVLKYYSGERGSTNSLANQIQVFIN